MSTGLNKEELRRFQRQRLGELPESSRKEQSKALANTLEAWLKRYHPTAVVGFFHPMADEPDIFALALRWIKDGGSACLPRVGDKSSPLQWFALDRPESLTRGSFGLMEPNPDRCLLHPPSSLDVVLVPGLAFSIPTGFRLGRGGGFYDRTLDDPKFTALAIGTALPNHLVADVPSLPHDQRMDFIATIDTLVPCSDKAKHSAES